MTEIMDVSELTIDESTAELLGYNRKVRDPIYDYIPLTKLESTIIDTKPYQRLDRIGQMHSVHKVYPSANYTRKVHSLGVLHLMGKAINRILYLQTDLHNRIPSPFYADQQAAVTDIPSELDDLSYILGIFAYFSEFDEGIVEELAEARDDGCRAEVNKMNSREQLHSGLFVFQAARLLGLLHDVGHGPFSHKLENIEGVDFDHEEMAPEVITEIQAKATQKLDSDGISDTAKENFNKLLDFSKVLLSTDTEELDALKFMRELTNHPFDCDMLDYIARDAYFAGTPEYGSIDSNRIVKGFVVEGERLRISKGEMKALRNLFESTFDMHRTVYTHKTVRMYDNILENSFMKFAEIIQSIVDDSSEFVTHDDCSFIKHLEDKEQLKDRYYRGMEIYRDFENRNKPYEELYKAPLVVDVAVFMEEFDQGDYEAPVNMLEEELEEAFDRIRMSADPLDIEEDQVIYDPAYDIRRVGLDLRQLFTWIQKDLLYDPDAGKFVPIMSVDPDVKERILTVEVPARVFISREVQREEQHKFKEEIEGHFTDLRHKKAWFKSN